MVILDTEVFLMPRGWMDHPALTAGREPFDRRSAYAWLMDRAFQCAGPFTLEGYSLRLERGQFAASTRYLARVWGWDDRTVRRFLNRLKTAALIDTDTAAGITRITICNYNEIQSAAARRAAPSNTVAAAEVPHTRRKTEESKTLNNVPETRDSPEGVQGEGRDSRRRHPGEWSPKVNHPAQLDLISNTALAVDYAPAADPEPVDEPEPELPLMLSVEGEVIPPGEHLPAVVPAAPPKPPVLASNVVKLRPETDPDFQEFYATYPRKKKPLDAAKAYAEARRRASASELLEGARRCRDEASGKEKRFVAYPASWLRAGGWMEEAEPADQGFEGGYHGRDADHYREEKGPNALPGAIARILARRAQNA